MVFTNPLITIHIITIITPGLKTAPEGKLTRLAPPCSSSACLGWTLYTSPRTTASSRRSVTDCCLL